MSQTITRETKPNKKAKGIRILFNFSRCKGPLTIKDGVLVAVENAVNSSGVTVIDKVHFREFPDNTINATADLTESHFGLGTYLEARHVAGEVNMCHETSDNTGLARKLVECLHSAFKPEKEKIEEINWESE